MLVDGYFFDLSTSALNKVKDIIDMDSLKPNLRVGVKGSGCNGLSYHIEFTDQEPKEKDLIFNISELIILIDKKSIIYLNGAILDYENSLLNQRFVFRNPNEKSTCGCSMSFNV